MPKNEILRSIITLNKLGYYIIEINNRYFILTKSQLIIANNQVRIQGREITGLLQEKSLVWDHITFQPATSSIEETQIIQLIANIPQQIIIFNGYSQFIEYLSSNSSL